jgi:hypothetical protein
MSVTSPNERLLRTRGGRPGSSTASRRRAHGGRRRLCGKPGEPIVRCLIGVHGAAHALTPFGAAAVMRTLSAMRIRFLVALACGIMRRPCGTRARRCAIPPCECPSGCVAVAHARRHGAPMGSSSLRRRGASLGLRPGHVARARTRVEIAQQQVGAPACARRVTGSWVQDVAEDDRVAGQACWHAVWKNPSGTMARCVLHVLQLALDPCRVDALDAVRALLHHAARCGPSRRGSSASALISSSFSRRRGGIRLG